LHCDNFQKKIYRVGDKSTHGCDFRVGDGKVSEDRVDGENEKESDRKECRVHLELTRVKNRGKFKGLKVAGHAVRGRDEGKKWKCIG